jgi:hypothetical protein
MGRPEPPTLTNLTINPGARRPAGTPRAIGAIVGAIIGAVVILVFALRRYGVWREGDRFTLGRTRGIRAADGLRYRVHLAHADSDGAAETLAELNRRAITLMRHLRGKYLNGPSAGRFPARSRATKRLLGLYNPDNLAENSPQDPRGDTSYTLDKGAILAICLREKDPSRRGDPRAHDIHDIETLTYVTLHELTHIAIKEHDHPPLFWRAFKFVLEEAAEAGILQAVDYGRDPVVYCGVDIDYNPAFDSSIEPLI